MTLIILFLIAVLVAVLCIWVIPRVRKQQWVAEYFWWLEPIAILLFSKSESMFYSRFKSLVGALATLFGAILPALGAFDPTIIMPFLNFVPEQYRTMIVAVPAIALWLDGLVGARLRKTSTEPLSVVALPMDKQNLPEVVELREAKHEAVVAAKLEEAKP